MSEREREACMLAEKESLWAQTTTKGMVSQV